MRIAICDDERFAVDTIIEHLAHYKDQFPLMEEHPFISGSALADAIKRGEKYDVVFLDIKMNDMDGFQVSKVIRDHDDGQTSIIYVTAYEKYIQKAFDYDALHCLTKPITQENFSNIFDKASKKYTNDHFLYVMKRCEVVDENRPRNRYEHAKKVTVSLHIKDIIYLSSDKHIITLHEKGGQLYNMRTTISREEKRLRPYHFVVPHQSFLINMNYIYQFDDATICLKNTEEKIPISANKMSQFVAQYNNYVSRCKV